MRIVVVTSGASGNAARITHYLARAGPEATIVGAIVDRSTEADSSRQVRRLRAWWRHGGLPYATWRLWLMAEPKLRETAPSARYRWSLYELGQEHGFEVVDVPSVNSDPAVRALESFDADLGVSLGNRIIGPHVFGVPRDGMINLHHGAIPEYRGGPPAFWELYDGAATMGVTVHRIDEKLDHGEVLARGEVPVLAGDDPASLMLRARGIDYRLVAEAVRALATGTAAAIPVDLAGSHARTLPSRREQRRLEARLGRPVRHDGFRSAPLEEIPVDS